MWLECCLCVTEPGLVNVALHVGLGTYITCVYAQVINKVCDWVDLVGPVCVCVWVCASRAPCSTMLL